MFVGEVAALATSLCWALTGIFFTLGGRRVGSQVVNLTRLLLALVIMLLLHRLALGTWLPLGASVERWGWLALSGVIGLALGDAALFQALLFIGPRLAALLMALVPIISTLLAWAFLAERLAWLDVLAVCLTVAGVAWVVLERRTDDAGGAVAGRNFKWGVILGLGAASGQSLGLITSRLGLEGDFSVLSANLIRILAASVALWGAAAAVGQGGRPLAALRADRRAALTILAGTVVGPVLGVMLSLLAIQRAPVGIASTLMSLTPITILPLVYWIFRERISRRAVGGTFLAFSGVALIFLR
jgi:drug/metabolite transporter (DMT)-like permease